MFPFPPLAKNNLTYQKACAIAWGQAQAAVRELLFLAGTITHRQEHTPEITGEILCEPDYLGYTFRFQIDREYFARCRVRWEHTDTENDEPRLWLGQAVCVEGALLEKVLSDYFIPGYGFQVIYISQESTAKLLVMRPAKRSEDTHG